MPLLSLFVRQKSEFDETTRGVPPSRTLVFERKSESDVELLVRVGFHTTAISPGAEMARPLSPLDTLCSTGATMIRLLRWKTHDGEESVIGIGVEARTGPDDPELVGGVRDGQEALG